MLNGLKNENIFVKKFRKKNKNKKFREFKRYLHMEEKKEQKVATKYYCEICDYSTSRKYNFIKHKTTRKHLKLTNVDTTTTINSNYICECGMEYKHRQSLYVHKKKCEYLNKTIHNNIANIKKKGEDISKNELLNMIQTMLPMIGGNTTNTINNNINIQVFLDDKCKDAMTIQNFAEKLTMTLEDIIQNKEGIHVGVPNIVIKNLQPIPLVERPIHCTDEKNHTWMVKDENEGWTKDNGKKVIKVTGSEITKRFQCLWNEKFPDWQKSDDMQSKWLELIKSMNEPPSEEEVERALQKIKSECALNDTNMQEIMQISNNNTNV